MKDLRHVLEELHRPVDGHVEHVGYRLSFVAHLERLAVVALAVTHLAGHIDIGQEVHLNHLVAIALARLASASTYVEGETTGLVPPHLGFGQTDKEVADIAEDARIGGRIGTGRAAQGGLIDVDHLIYILQSLDSIVGQGGLQRTVEALRQDGLQRLVDEGRFTTARYPRHADQLA